MVNHRRKTRMLSVASALALLTACVAPTSTVTTKEKTVSNNVYSNVTINVNGRAYVLRTEDDKPLQQVSVQVLGERYDVKDGNLALPGSALKQAQSIGKGFFTVLAQGYSPRQIWLGQKEDLILLSPVQALTIYPNMGPSGGTIKSPDRAIQIQVPAGMIPKPETPVALSTYTPVITTEDKAQSPSKRADLLDILKGKSGVIAPGGGNYHVLAGNECAPPGPIQCPLDESLGLLVTVDGPIAPGKMLVGLDLAALLDEVDRDDYTGYSVLNHKSKKPRAGSAKSRAAKKLIDTFHDLDADADYKGWRQNLKAARGATVNGGSGLIFPIEIGTNQIANGSVTTEVEALDGFEVKIEVTVVSVAADGSLPPIALLPDMVALSPLNFINQGSNLISNNSAGLIANNGGGLISGNGGSLIGNNAGSLIGNNSGGLVSNNGSGLFGSVRVPFSPASAKFGLLGGLTEHDWPTNARVRAVDEFGNALTEWVTLDGDGMYRLPNVPSIGGVTFLECEAALYKLRTLAPAPGSNSNQRADINTVTTTVSSLVRQSVTGSQYGVEDIDPRSGYNTDLSIVRGEISQAQAEDAVRATNLGAPALIAKNILSVPASLNPPTLRKISVTFEELPNHKDTAKGLAVVTGLKESDVKIGKTVALNKRFTFVNGRLTIDNVGYGDALDSGPDIFNMFGLLAMQDVIPPADDAGASGAVQPTPAPTPTPVPPPPKPPAGPVKMLYTVEVQRGSGEIAKYRFRQQVSNYTMLEFNGLPLPLKVDLLEPRRAPGALLNNFWEYVDTQ